MGKVKDGHIDDLIADDRNANLGSKIGQQMIEKSIENLGLGRSVLVDKDNRLIAGNKTTNGARSKGVQKTIVVDTDGTELIVVRRTDLSLDSDEGRALAFADNKTAEMNLTWDPGNLQIHFDAAVNMGLDDLTFDIGFEHVSDADVAGMFTPREKDTSEDDDDEGYGMGGNITPFSIVLQYTEDDYHKVKEALGKVGGTPEQILFDLLGLTN